VQGEWFPLSSMLQRKFDEVSQRYAYIAATEPVQRDSKRSQERSSVKWCLNWTAKDSSRSRPFSAVASEGRPMMSDLE
jgi:hypothetical protein